MSHKKKKITFTYDQRLIYSTLGKEMIESQSIAFAEQIKNAADAGASIVKVDFSKIEQNEIVISDNGVGMDINEIQEGWFRIGTSIKSEETNLLGGKGIGRFSLFKIGNKIKITTVSKSGTCKFVIIKKDVKEKEDQYILFEEQGLQKPTGTTIVISDLNTNIDLKEIELELANLKHENNKLRIQYIYPKTFTEEKFLLPAKVKPLAPFTAEILIKDGSIDYQFTAQVNDAQLYGNTKFTQSISKELDSLMEENNCFRSLGPITFELWNFFFDKKVQLPDNVEGKSIEKYFLLCNQGINIYRNGFKIYGHGKEDWLKLAELRLKRAADNIDNKQSYGVIILSDKSTDILREKSNREGFLREGSKGFRALILCLVKQFGKDREAAVKIIKKKTSKDTSKLLKNSKTSAQNNYEATSKATEEMLKDVTVFHGNDIDLVEKLGNKKIEIDEVSTKKENLNLFIKDKTTIDGKTPVGEYVVYLKINDSIRQTVRLFIKQHSINTNNSQYNVLISSLTNIRKQFLNKLSEANENKIYSETYSKQIEVLDAILKDLNRQDIDIATVALCQIFIEISFRAFFREYNGQKWKDLFPVIKNDKSIEYDNDKFNASNMSEVYNHLSTKEMKKTIGSEFNNFYQPYNINKHHESRFSPQKGVQDFEHFCPLLYKLYELILKKYAE